MLTDNEVRSEFQTNYRYAHDYWAPFVKDAQVYTLACSGYTWSDQERKELIKEGREPLEMNIMRRPLNYFSGVLRDNIKEVVYGPLEDSDQQTADQLTKLSYYIWDKSRGFPTFLDAADEALKAGISLVGIQMDYSKDFINGDISFYKRTYNSFYLDPTFENLNLEDCSFAITRDLLDKQYVKQLCPFIDPKEIDDLAMSYRDDKFLQFHPEFTTFSRKRSLLAYDQYYRRITKEREFLIDLKTSYFRDITEHSEEEKKKLKFGINRFKRMKNTEGINSEEVPELEIRKVDRPYIELCIMLNGQIFYRGEDKTGITHTYPFVPLTCYFEPSIWMPSQRIQGIGAATWPTQRQFNKRHMKIVDMMDSDISTGFKYLIGSVPDPQELQQSGQSKIIGVDPENAPQGLDSVQQLRGGGTNPALIEYQQILDNLSLTLANVTESSLGIDDKGNAQLSGRLAQTRIVQGMIGNRKVFDMMETSQQLLGGLILKAIQTHYSAGKVERIIGETPTDQFYDQEYEQYECIVREGVRSQSQKDAYYYEIVNLKREGIVNVPESEIVDALSTSGLDKLKKSIERQEQMQAKQVAVQEEIQNKQMELLDATKEEKLGLAKERNSRTISNLALKDERESEAQQNIAQAALDRAKAITEIASMNENRILEVLRFINVLEQQEATGRELQKEQVAQQAKSINQDVDIKEDVNQQMDLLQEGQMQNGIMNDVNQGG